MKQRLLYCLTNYAFRPGLHHLSRWNLDLTAVDVSGDLTRRAAVNLATNGVCSTEDFLDGTSEGASAGAGSQLASNVQDLLEGDGTTVNDVLLLLAVTLGLVESLDDEKGSRRNDLDLSLTVLDDEADRDTETLVTLGLLCNIITNLLGSLYASNSSIMMCRAASYHVESCSGKRPIAEQRGIIGVWVAESEIAIGVGRGET